MEDALDPRSRRIPEPLILWEVLEEHLDEAEFLFTLWEQALDSPLYVLEELYGGLEARLFAHVDGLLVGGEAAAERLLIPCLEEFDPHSPDRVTVATLALLVAGRWRPVVDRLATAGGELRARLVRACGLIESRGVASWITTAASGRGDAGLLAALMTIEAAHGRAIPVPADLLERRDLPDCLVAALAMLRRTAPGQHLQAIERLLNDEDSRVREAALVTALSGHSSAAWDHCRTLAWRDGDGLAMRLVALLGRPSEQRQILLPQLERPACRADAIVALGLSGDVSMGETLLGMLGSEDPREARLAGEAFVALTGIDATDPTYLVEQPPVDDAVTFLDALPVLAEDNLDVDLSVDGVDELPLLDPEPVSRWWTHVRGDLSCSRHLRGRPWTIESAVRYLSSAPLRGRHDIALWLALQSGGRLWLDTRRFAGQQRAQLRAMARGGAV